MGCFLFSRPFYFALGMGGLGLDFLGHYYAALAQYTPDPLLTTVKLLIGWSDPFLAMQAYTPFAIGIAAHMMFLFALVLLGLRGR